MRRRGSRSWCRASSWARAKSRPRCTSRRSGRPARRGRKSRPRAERRYPSSSSRSRIRKAPGSASWGDDGDDRRNRSRGRPPGLDPREAPPERGGDRRSERGEGDRHGPQAGRVRRVSRAPCTREHREPDARHRAELSAEAGHDPPAHDLPHDAVPATARSGGAQAPPGVPILAGRVQGQASRDRRGGETTSPGAVHQPRGDLETPGVQVRGLRMKAIVASGKRKTAVARATLTKGRGVVRINSVPVEIYPFELGRLKILEPLNLAGRTVDSIDIDVNVQGGGIMGQADAVRTAIARGLVQYLNDNELETLFREYDRTLIVPDTRRKLPKKPLGRGARKKRQKSYR